MPDHSETLKSMLQSIINDRQEEAAVTMHQYFVAKTREVVGLGDQSPDERIEPTFDDEDLDQE